MSSLHWEPSRGRREQEDAGRVKGCITKGHKGRAKEVSKKAWGCWGV